ncbi:MAG TPA: hypothetical protein VJG65_01455 [Patescibacteria group bacterium]|nr:hypothetical protein [Patescibacteria group bacterium]
MDFLDAKINQIVINQNGRISSTVRTFATKPNRALAKNLGKIFGLIEIESVDPKISGLIDLIIEEIKNNYYHPKLDEKNQLEISARFETALKKTNLAIAAFLETEQISLDLERVSFLIGICHNLEIHFTVSGSVNAFLFYSLPRENYRIINVIEMSQTQAGSPEPLKFFSQVISGRLRPKDIFFVNTANILDYFSLEKIKNHFVGKTVGEGVNDLNETLKNVKVAKNFGFLTMELDRISVPAKKSFDVREFNYQKAASKDSMIALIKTERETQKFLTPSMLPEIKKYVVFLKLGLQNYLNKVKSGTKFFYQQNSKFVKPAINLPKLPTINLDLENKFKKAKNFNLNFWPKIFLPFNFLFKTLSAKIRHWPIWPILTRPGRKIFHQLNLKFKALPRSSQILLIITIILGFLFSQSLIGLTLKNRQQKRFEEYNQLIAEAENKKNEAASSLIYRDENQARIILSEAKNILADLKKPSKSQKEKIDSLSLEVNAQLKNLQHLTEIAEPIQIANLANLDPEIKIGPFAVLNGNILFTQNQKNSAIYRTNLDRRTISAIYSPDTVLGNVDFGLNVNGQEIILFNQNEKKVFSFNQTNETFQLIDLKFSEADKIIDATFYNSRLYLLNIGKNQIDRYAKTPDGFGNQSNWLTDQIDLSKAVSLAVDGSVYLLNNNGEILKLENGKKTDFKIDLIDPALVNPTKIKTAEASDYIYTLDPSTKRLVVLDKEGNLIQQYTSPAFNNLKDFAVSESSKKIYLLSENTIFGIPAEHLK